MAGVVDSTQLRSWFLIPKKKLVKKNVSVERDEVSSVGADYVLRLSKIERTAAARGGEVVSYVFWDRFDNYAVTIMAKARCPPKFYASGTFYTLSIIMLADSG